MSRKQVPPTIEDVRKYVLEQGYKIDADHFFDHHEARGWWLGKVKMRDWQAAVRTWVRQDKRFNPTGNETEKKWHETSDGIIKMGETLGIIQGDYQHFPAFKSAVFEAYRNKSGQGHLKLVV